MTAAAPHPWIARHGHPQPPAERLALRAGPVGLVFEDGDLRYLRIGGTEILRRIYVMVRDHAWNTYPPRIEDLHTEIHADRFLIRYRALHAGEPAGRGPLRYLSEVEMAGDAAGCITVAFHGRSQLALEANRIGLCVLHPAPACCLAPVTIEHVDGSLARRVFPRLIAPQEPFTDIAAMVIEPLPGVRQRLEFSGAVFETEDQRNFGDASFKTFSTPLRMPRPVHVPAGTEHRQQVRMTLQGPVPAEPAREPAQASLQVLPEGARAVPPVGIDTGDDARHLVPERLRALGVGFLHADLLLAEPGWQERLGRVTAAARAAGLALDLALVLENEPQPGDLATVRAAAEAAAAVEAPVASWTLARRAEMPGAELVAAALPVLARARPQALRGVAGWTGFVAANRARPSHPALDLVSFAINQQGHGSDGSTVMENLGAIAACIASAQAFATTAAVGVWLRSMPRAQEAANHPRRARDHRWDALFGAAWAVAACGQVLAAEAARLTLGATSGADTVFAGAPAAGRLHPFALVLAEVARWTGSPIVPLAVDQPLRVGACAARTPQGLRVLVANLTPHPLVVAGPVLPGVCAVRWLDETTVAGAQADPTPWQGVPSVPWTSGSLALRPYAVALVEAP